MVEPTAPGRPVRGQIRGRGTCSAKAARGESRGTASATTGRLRATTSPRADLLAFLGSSTTEPRARQRETRDVGDPASDASIIASSIDDPDRFGLIFERHFGAIHAYLQRRVGDDSADDLATETFLKAFRARASYDRSRESSRPWLFGIAANVIHHHRRREARQLRAYRRLGPPPIEAPADADLSAVARELASLPLADREVLFLHAWADLSYAEIAEALDVPIGTVRSRLSRARARIREQINAGRESGDRTMPLEGAPDGRA